MKKMGFPGTSKCSFREDKSMGRYIKLNKPQRSNLWAVEPERERGDKARKARKSREESRRATRGKTGTELDIR